MTHREAFMNVLQHEVMSPWNSVRFDAFTHHYALEYMKTYHPKVLFISYGETDDFAHDGNYDRYLKSARQTDAFIEEIWNFVQSDSQYKDKTTLIITTDHGRGHSPIDQWKHHNKNITGASAIWLAVLGPDKPALGEVKTPGQLYQKQVARTMAKALGRDFVNPRDAHEALPVLH